jgi:hypothetical protein
MIDQKSNQTFFSPVINKRTNEPGRKKEIWIDLYNKHKTIKVKREESVKKNIEEYNNIHSKKLVSENSQKITEEIESNMVKKLFELLDCNGDSMITEEDLKNDNIIMNELKVLNPIFDGIKGEVKLDLIEFQKQLNEKISSYNDRKIIKDWYMNHKNQHSHRCTHNKTNEPQFSYHVLISLKKPVVSDSSKEVLSKSKRHSKGFMARNIEFYKRRMTIQQEQLNKTEELDIGKTFIYIECTFRPSLEKKLVDSSNNKRKSKIFTSLTKRATVNLDKNV